MSRSIQISMLSYWFTLAVGLVLCVFLFAGALNFGHGLGDLIYGILLGVLFTVHLIFTLDLRRRRRSRTGIRFINGWTVVFTCLYVFLLLKAVVWSGPENP